MEMFGADMLLKIFCQSLSGIFTHAALINKECFSFFLEFGAGQKKIKKVRLMLHGRSKMESLVWIKTALLTVV